MRPGLLRAAVVIIQQPAEFAARHLGDQRHRAGLRPLAAQHRPRPDAGNVVGEQQVALEIGVVDRPPPEQVVEHFEYEDTGGADIAFELDVADVAFDRADDEHDLAA